MGAWVDGMPERFGVARERYILRAVAAGKASIPMTNIFVKIAGKKLRVSVSAIPLSIDHLMVNTTYRTAQYIAYLLDMVMMTPHVGSMIEGKADVRVSSPTWAPDSSKSQMIKHSDMMWARIANTGQVGLMSLADKIWALSKRLYGNRAMNYGLFKDGVLRQGPAMGHSIDDHTDYSQTLRYIGRDVYVDDVPHLTTEVLLDDELAPALTGLEGVLPFTHHPSIPICRTLELCLASYPKLSGELPGEPPAEDEPESRQMLRRIAVAGAVGAAVGAIWTWRRGDA